MIQLVPISDLKELFEYKPRLGEIRHRMSRGRGVKGALPGFIDTRGYRNIKFMIDGVRYTCGAHRLAWVLYYGEWPKGIVDHWNRDKQDNRISNLRDTTQSVNVSRKITAPRSLPRGVYWAYHTNMTNPYLMQFSHKGTKVQRYFATPEEAAKAYREEFRAAHGKYPEEL